MKNDGKDTLARVRRDANGDLHISYANGIRVELPCGDVKALQLQDLLEEIYVNKVDR